MYSLTEKNHNPQEKAMKTYSFVFKDARQTSLLYLVLREDGKREKISLQLKEDPATFDKKNYIFTKDNPYHKTLNARLNIIKSKMELLVREAEVTNEPLLQFRNRVAEAINAKTTEKANKGTDALFLPYFLKWAMTENTKHKYNRYKKYTYNMLVEYFEGKAKPTFDDINYAFCENFIEWMSNKGLCANTRGSHVKFVKAAMNEALKNKLHKNEDFHSFRKEVEQIDAVYLTNEEVTKIAQLPLCGTHAIARDIFIIGCHTGMRFSDYSRLSMKDISDGVIHFITQKCKTPVDIPAHPRVLAILDKYNGILPSISPQKFNVYIKDVCKEAGLTESITVRKGGQHVRHEKWELVSSHTARRTGLTNMYKAGIPTYRCMMISGHKTEQVFLTYLRITQQENAQFLKENSFFKL
jgi:integrase